MLTRCCRADCLARRRGSQTLAHGCCPCVVRCPICAEPDLCLASLDPLRIPAAGHIQIRAAAARLGRLSARDVVSGLVTGLFSIPEGMAYASIGGFNPVAGGMCLVAALLAGLE